MAVVLANKHEKEAVEMRAALCETLMQLAETREDIVYLDADLFGSSGMKKFAKAYPDRAFDVGIAEANMVDMAGRHVHHGADSVLLHVCRVRRTQLRSDPQRRMLSALQCQAGLHPCGPERRRGRPAAIRPSRTSP